MSSQVTYYVSPQTAENCDILLIMGIVSGETVNRSIGSRLCSNATLRGNTE